MTPEQSKCLELSKKAFELVEDRIPAASVGFIRENIYDYNEWGLGVETIVDALVEDDIAITAAQRDAIIEALDAMGLNGSQHMLTVNE